MAYLLGIDVSTTATKALLITDSGVVTAEASSEYGYETPRPLWSQQDPALWWRGARESIRAVLTKSGIAPGEILAVGLTGQMHGLVLVDEEGIPLRPAILWNDGRTAAECDEIRRRVGRERLIQVTGNDALTGFTAPKVLWVQSHEPELFAKARHLLLPKDYVRFQLTGEYAMDMADGSGTILMDLRQRNWSQEVVRALGIPPAWLPPLYEGPQVTGRVTAQAAEATGLLAGTPVVAGGGDQSAQAVGVGAVSEGVVALTLGTSGVVFASSDRPVIEPDGRLHAFCHALPDTWHMMGVMLSAAGSLRWYRDTLAPGVGYDALLEPARQVPPGCEGLFFLPYLSGERTPHPDPLARGAFIGLTIRHNQSHLTRAVLEGVGFGLRDGFELMKQAGLAATHQVRLSGGGARSPLWRQILANILNSELVTVTTPEAAAYGSALLAGVGTGVWPDTRTACAQMVQPTGSTIPTREGVESYEGAYQVYRELYPTLRPIFHHPTVTIPLKTGHPDAREANF